MGAEIGKGKGGFLGSRSPDGLTGSVGAKEAFQKVETFLVEKVIHRVQSEIAEL